MRSGVAHGDALEQLVVGERVERRLGRVGVEPGPALLQRAQRLLQRLAERAADGHDLAHRLHAGARARPSAPGSFSKAQRGILVTT